MAAAERRRPAGRAARGDILLIASLAVLISTVCGQEAALNAHPACVNFTRGNEVLREFYSPGWPGRYPKNANCTRTLTAPEGQVIEIDFRDKFHLEPSPKCENDYLLIRDGREAYSPAIRRSCGNAFPRLVTSSSRHLWLSFQSDETIEYDGFKAVYAFKPAQVQLQPPRCRFELTGPEAIISTDNITEESVAYAERNRLPIDCTWRVTVTPGKEIQVYFKQFSLAKPNECELNFVEILSGPELLLRRKQHFCSSKAESVKMGQDNDVTFRFYAARSSLVSAKTRILAVITEMRLRSSEEQCLPTEFDCDDLYCINRSLVCNGNFNCDKLLDEKADCDRTSEQHALAFLTTNSNIVIMTIGCGLLFGMCFSMCWNCIRKLRQDFREKQESVRRPHDDGALLRPGRGRLAADPGCYVPSVELKAEFLPSPALNGSLGSGVGIVREETVDTDIDTAEVAIQTRPRLARAPAVSRSASRTSRGSRHSRDSDDSDGSPPPPPPPTRSCPHGPPISPFPEDHYRGAPPPPPPPPGGGPLYGGSLHCDLHRPRTLPKARSVHAGVEVPGRGEEGCSGRATPRRYRAEAVIEMGTRPHSLQSARSAPDVVVKI
ncbi:neuropilin and tolloid-like protein 2 [Amphibalanus amphitrite]|uniref:neuropilin and tolloid-like protein 2 n=1 Tax=Amphibalanus amphitrite TaxID=1232801 RepID=UPI001C9092CB|nr:neuropilin and tolloid-like protein 2 [Amphibalanus amphitrite]